MDFEYEMVVVHGLYLANNEHNFGGASLGKKSMTSDM